MSLDVNVEHIKEFLKIHFETVNKNIDKVNEQVEKLWAKIDEHEKSRSEDREKLIVLETRVANIEGSMNTACTKLDTTTFSVKKILWVAGGITGFLTFLSAILFFGAKLVEILRK